MAPETEGDKPWTKSSRNLWMNTPDRPAGESGTTSASAPGPAPDVVLVRGEPATTREWRATLPTAFVVLAVFLNHVVGGVYAGLGRELPDSFPFLGTLFLAVSLANWFWSYSRGHKAPWILDLGWFLLGAWPVVIPYYVIRREGRRGLARVALFLFTYFAAWATGQAIAIWLRVLGAE